jgi:hypothetical protein
VRRVGARYVEDVDPVEDGERAAVADALREHVEVPLRDRRQRRGREIGMAERHDLRQQREAAAVLGHDVPQAREGVQVAAHGRAREPGPLADLRDRERALLVGEGVDDGEAPGRAKRRNPGPPRTAGRVACPLLTASLIIFCFNYRFR